MQGFQKWRFWFQQKKDARKLQNLTRESDCFKLVEGYCKVVDVYDGDTCTVMMYYPGMSLPMKHKVRLFGIDTPEMRPPLTMENRDSEIRRANAAKVHLYSMVADQVVRYKYQGTDKYGRLLMSLYTLNGSDVCKNLVDNGFAKSYFL